MTRFIHDRFAKDYLEELLTPYGTIQSPRRVAGEVRQVDLWFSPSPESACSPQPLGILARAIQPPAYSSLSATPLPLIKSAIVC